MGIVHYKQDVRGVVWRCRRQVLEFLWRAASPATTCPGTGGTLAKLGVLNNKTFVLSMEMILKLSLLALVYEGMDECVVWYLAPGVGHLRHGQVHQLLLAPGAGGWKELQCSVNTLIVLL